MRSLPPSPSRSIQGFSALETQLYRFQAWCSTVFPVYSEFAVFPRFSLGAHTDAEAHISTEPPPPIQDPWLSRTHEDQSRASCTFPPPRQGPQACLRQRRVPRLAANFAAFLLPVENPNIFDVERGRYDTLCVRLREQSFYGRCETFPDVSWHTRATMEGTGARWQPVQQSQIVSGKKVLRAVGGCENTPIISVYIVKASASRCHS